MAIYELAYNLRVPVYILENEMPYSEFLNWGKYFDARPIGWREDDRTYKLLNAQGVKEKPWAIFPSLFSIKRYSEKIKAGRPGTLDMGNFASSEMFSRINSAKNGERLDL